MTTGITYVAAARAAVAATATIGGAIRSVTQHLTAPSMPSFGEVLAAEGAEKKPQDRPPSLTDQLIERVESLLRAAGIDLVAPVSLVATPENRLSVDGSHPQRELIEIAIAHDLAIEQLAADWRAESENNPERQPPVLTIGPH